MKVVAEGTDFDSFPTDINLLREGEEGEVRVYLERQLSRDELKRLQDELLKRGAVLTAPVHMVSNVLIIPFRKEFDPLGPIKTVLDIITKPFQVGWQIIKTVQSIPWWVLVGGVGIGAYLLFSSKSLQGFVRDTQSTGKKAALAYVTKGAIR